ncbi:MAG: hypothetical protein AB7O21_13360 [Gammaproteobacteria bacterium]
MRIRTLIVEGDATAWNIAVTGAFADAADAVILQSRPLALPQGLPDALAACREDRQDLVAGYRVADAKHAERFLLPGPRWSDRHFGWRSEWYVELKPDPAAPPFVACHWLNPYALFIPRAAWNIVGPFDPVLPPSLAVIDWCLRARKVGMECLEFQTPIALELSAEPARSAPWGNSRIQDLPGILRLARKHGQPTGPLRLALRFLARSIVEDFRSVRFWADYGHVLSLSKRSLWYASNLWRVLQRAGLSRVAFRVMRICLRVTTTRSTE